MWKDPIVEEIHKIREEYAASLNHDLQAIYDDLKKQEDEERKAGRTIVSLHSLHPEKTRNQE
ncbi:MAG: hypothetical protein C4527_11625 [Candidatus Omnitrophota bacterium]|jgi:uncharacterized protein (UPF0335 family)|nr:MAG: hypothetical protein C4527_11625 [Candidatus Omnitrophota bacterium]